MDLNQIHNSGFFLSKSHSSLHFYQNMNSTDVTETSVCQYIKRLPSIFYKWEGTQETKDLLPNLSPTFPAKQALQGRVQEAGVCLEGERDRPRVLSKQPRLPWPYPGLHGLYLVLT